MNKSYLVIDKDILKKLFSFLEQELDKRGCNLTLEMTEEFCAKINFDFESMKYFLNKNGAYCDCEVLLNAVYKMEHNTENRSK